MTSGRNRNRGMDRDATRGDEAGAWLRARGAGWGLARVHADGAIESMALFDRAVVGCSGDRMGVVSSDAVGSGARFGVRADGVYVESLDETCVVRVDGVPTRKSIVHDGDVVRIGEVLALFVERDLGQYDGPFELVHGELLFGPRQRPWLARLRAHVTARESVLLTGGASVGKWSLARHLGSEAAGRSGMRELDGDMHSQNIDWGAVPLQSTTVYLVRHIDRMSRSVQNELARAIRRARHGMLIATMNGELADALTDGLIAPSIMALIGSREVVVPSLEDRREDLAWMSLMLADRLGVPRAAVTMDVFEAVMRGGWPGGIDELGKVIGTCLASADPEGTKRLVRSLKRPTPRAPLSVQDVDETLARDRLRHALAHAGGTVATAARELRMSRQSLYRELRRLGLTPPHQGASDTRAAS